MLACWTGPSSQHLGPSAPHPDGPASRTDIFTGSSAEGSGPPGQGLCTRPTNLHVRALHSAGRAWSLRGAHSGGAPSVAPGFLRDLVAFRAGVDATRHWGTGYNVTQGAGVFRGSVLPPELSYFLVPSSTCI